MIQPMQLLALTQPCFVQKQLSKLLCGASRAGCAPGQSRERARDGR